MFKKIIPALLIMASIICTDVVYAQEKTEDNAEALTKVDSTQVTKNTPAPKKEKSIDWLSLIIGGGYFLGVFGLFPLVVYTNLKEKIVVDTPENADKIKPIETLSAQQRNEQAAIILEDIEQKLTPYTDNDGVERITITKGKQARFMKRGLDYINTRLCPTDPEIIDRVDEFINVYSHRTERYFSGSKWILGCAIGVLVLMGFADIGIIFSAFGLIHILGIAFYFLSSRVPDYLLERRMKNFGSKGKGLVGGIMAALFAGAAANHYVSVNGGAWQRDHESEFSNGIFMLMMVAIVAIFAGFLVSLFGVINFVLNYSGNYIWPFKSNDQWYTETYQRIAA